MFRRYSGCFDNYAQIPFLTGETIPPLYEMAIFALMDVRSMCRKMSTEPALFALWDVCQPFQHVNTPC